MRIHYNLVCPDGYRDRCGDRGGTIAREKKGGELLFG